jgi:hypothetical protein
VFRSVWGTPNYGTRQVGVGAITSDGVGVGARGVDDGVGALELRRPPPQVQHHFHCLPELTLQIEIKKPEMD